MSMLVHCGSAGPKMFFTCYPGQKYHRWDSQMSLSQQSIKIQPHMLDFCDWTIKVVYKSVYIVLGLKIPI